MLCFVSQYHFLGGGGGGGDGRTLVGGAGFEFAPSLNGRPPVDAGGLGGGGFDAFFPIFFLPGFFQELYPLHVGNAY